MAKLKVVELFAGVGGFRVGLENVNESLNKKKYDFVWANQWEPGKTAQHAYDCYETHYGKGSCVNKDIATVIDDVPDHDLLVGGFPCQDYSVAHTGAKGIEGKKGVLWWSIDKILNNKSPKYVLLENVDRLLKSPSAQRGRDFGIILKCFAEKGYDVDWMMINAADYGYVQKRRRVFIFAHKSDAKKSKKKNTFDIDNLNGDDLINNNFFTKEFKVKELKGLTSCDLTKFKDIVSVSDNFNDGKFLNMGSMRKGKVIMADYKADYDAAKNGKKLKEILEKKADEKYFLTADQILKAKATKDSKKIERTSSTGFKYNYSEGAMCFPDNINGPARTMLTSEGTLNRSTHYIGVGPGDKKIRTLTPVETERINGFPDNWTNTGMPEKFRYFCMGNALVVDLVEKFGDMLNKYDKY